MTRLFEGRHTASVEGSFVVFLIGMRINRILAFREWLPVIASMPEMTRELEQHPEKGFLGAERCFFSPRSPAVIQYWRSFEDLERFARDRDATHMPAWQKFNREVGPKGSVGIWHETYLVEAGNYEAIYRNMPLFGFAKVAGLQPVSGRRETARDRIGERGGPSPPVG